MKSLQELQAKQAAELALFEKQEEIKALLPNIEFSLSIGWKTKFDLRFNLKNNTADEIKSIVKTVIDAMPPTKEVHPIYDCIYYFNFSNPCRYEYHVDFTYLHNGISVDFNLPLTAIDSKLLAIGSRKITDCEYHYFTGMTINEMMKMDFRTYCLNAGILQQPYISYFGGSKSYRSNFDADYNTIVKLLTLS